MKHREILILALAAFSDLGKKNQEEIIKNYDENMLVYQDYSDDPITAIVVRAITGNEADQEGVDSMVNNLDYAISELKRVALALERIKE